MEKKICFVYDDIEKPSRIISGIIGKKDIVRLFTRKLNL